MTKKTASPHFSASICNFLDMVATAKSDYTWNSEEINRLDRLTQDFLHMMELGGLDYKGRAKIATKLTHCRQERRASKDTTEILEPLITFLESDNGKKMINLMSETLGKTRKIEERMSQRTYRYKVLDLDNIKTR